MKRYWHAEYEHRLYNFACALFNIVTGNPVMWYYCVIICIKFGALLNFNYGPL